MLEFLSYFDTASTLERFLWLVFCLFFTSIVELISPFRTVTYKRLVHLKVNGPLLISTMIINAAFASVILLVCHFNTQSQFGFLHWVSLPIWAQLLITLLFLDFFAQYFVHYLLHKIPLLWRFHKIHHSDTHVDATTGTRHHPIDYTLREIFSLAAIFLLGTPFAYYLLYRYLTILFTYFTHANITLPNKVDKIISYVFVTPKAHKFHHHHKMPWTDSNFGNMWVFWDKLFGTFVYQDTQKIRYGVDTMDDTHANNLPYQLRIPFK